MTNDKMKQLILYLILLLAVPASAQTLKKVYDEKADASVQIDSALTAARKEGKNVICQVGGNWCPWCLKFADFITSDDEISSLIDSHYVYLHVNYARKSNDTKTLAVMSRLGNPQRFGFPVLVVLRPDGSVAHIQDSSFLEEGEGYNKKKVLRFLKNWVPSVMP